MRYLLLVSTLLVGCASNPSTVEHDELTKEVASQILSEKIAKNGELLLCSQPGYTACFEIDQAQCIKESAPLKKLCMDTATKKVGEIKIGQTDKKYGEIFGACMAMRHLLLHPDKVTEISACMSKISYDKDRAVRSLLR